MRSRISRILQKGSKLIIFDLESHQENVKRMLQRWNKKFFPIGDKERLTKSGERHDEKKPEYFQFTLRLKDGRPLIGYNFYYHARKFEDSDIYVEQLVQNHHAYSVCDIVYACNKLKKGGENPEFFPNDLYALQYCDKLDSILVKEFFEYRFLSERHIGAILRMHPKDVMTVRLTPNPFDRKLSLTSRYTTFNLSDKRVEDQKTQLKEKLEGIMFEKQLAVCITE